MEKIHGEIWTTCNRDGHWVLTLDTQDKMMRVVPKEEIKQKLISLGLTHEGDTFIYENGSIRPYDKLKDDDLESHRFYYNFFKTIYKQDGGCGIDKDEAFRKMIECEKDIITISKYRNVPIVFEEEDDKDN